MCISKSLGYTSEVVSHVCISFENWDEQGPVDLVNCYRYEIDCRIKTTMSKYKMYLENMSNDAAGCVSFHNFYNLN